MSAIKYKCPDGQYRVLNKDELRNMTLDRCYAIPGYADLPIAQKNIIYDRTRSEIVRELARRL